MFNDTEHRILLSAMRRERDICKEVDRKTIREPYEDTLLYICNSIDKKIHDIQHKYRWHDLRKNPEDLPTEYYLEDGYVDPSKYVLVCTSTKQYFVSRYWGHRRSKGTYIGNEPNDWVDLEFYNDVIAWKELEPFEEVE